MDDKQSKINPYWDIYYKGNKQDHEINLLEKITLFKVVRESISEQVALSGTQIIRRCHYKSS